MKKRKWLAPGEYLRGILPEFLMENTRPQPDSCADIRARGWQVAVHNDYRLHGRPYTFWLFTKAVPTQGEYGNLDGYFVKGEGATDVDALNEIRQKLHLPLL